MVAEGVRAVRELGGAGPVTAAIGPGAGGCCYEVGDEVHAAFADHGPGVRDGRNLDLKAIARRELEAAGVAEVHDVGVCTLCADPGLFFSHRRDGGTTGRQAGSGVAELSAERVRANLAAGARRDRRRAARRARPGRASRSSPRSSTWTRSELGALAEAGITLLGENRAQELVAKAERWPDRFTWDFIGQLQSRKVKQILPYVRLIQSVASDSALRQLERHADPGDRDPRRGQPGRRGVEERDRPRGARRLPGAGAGARRPA